LARLGTLVAGDRPNYIENPMNIDPSIAAAFAPSGKLRASLNLGNPILVNKNSATGEPSGVSIDLAREFAKRLAIDIEWVVFDTAAKSVEAVGEERADIGFFAVDPLRGASIAFTAPYVLIEGFYLVRSESAIHTNVDVDAESNRVVVGKGSAYDLFLSRELKHAHIVRAPSSPTVVQTFIEQGLEVAAGVKQQLEADASKTPGLRLLDQRFMVIQQAMGIPKSRGDAAADVLRQFVEDMKASGFVAASLARHGIAGASVAPAA
jgi:polar amino acid transport system substrate-binding protein